MFVKRRITIVLALAGLSLPALAQSPAGYPADYAKVVDAAKKEGKVVVYSTTDSKAAEALIRDFSTLYPAVKVEYNDMNSTEVYNRFISEAAAGGATADVMWSSSMDLQMKLASEGYGLAYKSPEAVAVPGHCNSGGIISAVFQPSQPLDDDRHYPLLAHISHYAAHC